MIRNFHIRFAMILMPFFVMAAMMVPSEAAAQDDRDCICDVVTFNVDINVRCKVTVCVLSPDGPRNCTTIAPGTRAKLRCFPGSTIYILDCRNELVPLYPECTRGIGAGPNCCTVDACFSPDSKCPVINITPSILDVCPCL